MVVALGLGVLAPNAENALSGAGWEASGSESRPRPARLIDATFGGQGATASGRRPRREPDLSDHDAGSPKQIRRGSARSRGDDRDPAAGRRVDLARRPQGRDPRRRGGAEPDGMVRAADDLKAKLAQLAARHATASLTGAAGMWSDFNQANEAR